MKVCTKCKRELSEVYFTKRNPRPNGAYKDGLEYQCKLCRRERENKIRKWKQKYRKVDERTLIKVRETEKHYFSENELLYIKLKIGYKRVTQKQIFVNKKRYSVEKLRNKYFETA